MTTEELREKYPDLVQEIRQQLMEELANDSRDEGILNENDESDCVLSELLAPTKEELEKRRVVKVLIDR